MATGFSITIDSSKASAFLIGLPDAVLKKAVAKSLNEAAKIVREIVQDDIGERLKLKKQDLNSAITIQNAKAAAEIEDQFSAVRVSSKPQSLLNFSPIQTAEGVTVNIKGQRKLVRGAFIARMPNATKGVFIRKNKIKPGTPTRRAGTNNSQLPIQKLYTTRATDVFTDQKGRYMLAASEDVDKRFQVNFDYYYNKYLDK